MGCAAFLELEDCLFVVWVEGCFGAVELARSALAAKSNFLVVRGGLGSNREDARRWCCIIWMSR